MKHYIFSTQLQLSNEKQRDCPYRKKQGPMSVGFPIRCCDHNSSRLCVSVITTVADVVSQSISSAPGIDLVNVDCLSLLAQLHWVVLPRVHHTIA